MIIMYEQVESLTLCIIFSDLKAADAVMAAKAAAGNRRRGRLGLDRMAWTNHSQDLYRR